MSLLPILFDELMDDYRRSRYHDIHDQHFGLGLLENQLRQPARIFSSPLYCGGNYNNWRRRLIEDFGLFPFKSSNEFRVHLDVQQFKPEELKVRVEGDFIVVDGKHEERSDEHGFISRQFTRKYKVPEDVDINAIISNLSSDGILSLQAPRKVPTENPSREITISHTNAPALKQTRNEENKNNKIE